MRRQFTLLCWLLLQDWNGCHHKHFLQLTQKWYQVQSLCSIERVLEIQFLAKELCHFDGLLPLLSFYFLNMQRKKSDKKLFCITLYVCGLKLSYVLLNNLTLTFPAYSEFIIDFSHYCSSSRVLRFSILNLKLQIQMYFKHELQQSISNII